MVQYFPQKFADFGPPVKDNKDVIYDFHINTLRDEVLHIEKFLGLDTLFRPDVLAWDKQYPSVGDSFSSLKDRLNWLDSGLILHHHDDRYVLLRGGSTIQHPASAPALTLLNRADNSPTLLVKDANGADQIRLNGFLGSVESRSLDVILRPDLTGMAGLTMFSSSPAPFMALTRDRNNRNLVEITADGDLDLGGRQVFRQSKPPYLQLMLNQNQPAITVWSDREDGVWLQGSSAQSHTTLANGGSLRMSSHGSSVALLPTSLTFVGDSQINLGAVGVESRSRDLHVYGDSTNLHASTVYLNNTVKMPKYRIKYWSEEELWATSSTLWGFEAFRGQRFPNQFDYLRTTKIDPTSGFNIGPTIKTDIRFEAPPSGQVTMHLTARFRANLSCTVLGWECRRTDTGALHEFSYRNARKQAVPHVSRGLVWRHDTEDANLPASANNWFNVVTLSNEFLLYELIPGVEYTINLMGAYSVHDPASVGRDARNAGKLDDIRVLIRPVIA